MFLKKKTEKLPEAYLACKIYNFIEKMCKKMSRKYKEDYGYLKVAMMIKSFLDEQGEY